MNESLELEGKQFTLVKEQRLGIRVYRGKNLYARVGPQEPIERSLALHTRMEDAGFPMAPFISKGVVGNLHYYIEKSLGEKRFTDLFAEDFAGADVVQSDVAFDRGLDVAMTKDLSDQLVVTWIMLQNDGPGSMSELMCRYAQTSEFADPLGYLTAECDLAL